MVCSHSQQSCSHPEIANCLRAWPASRVASLGQRVPVQSLDLEALYAFRKGLFTFSTELFASRNRQLLAPVVSITRGVARAAGASAVIRFGGFVRISEGLVHTFKRVVRNSEGFVHTFKRVVRNSEG